jgi:hypothetical protein
MHQGRKYKKRNKLLTSGKCALVIDLHIDGPDPGNEQAIDGLVPLGFPVSGSEKRSKNTHFYNQKNPAKNFTFYIATILKYKNTRSVLRIRIQECKN